MKRTPLRPVSTRTAARNRRLALIPRGRCTFAEHVYAAGMGTVHYPDCGGGIELHHIAPRSVAPHLVEDPANLVALCHTHHAWVTDHPKDAHALGLHRYSWEVS